MLQIDEKRKGETGNGLRKVQRKQTWGSQRAGKGWEMILKNIKKGGMNGNKENSMQKR